MSDIADLVKEARLAATVEEKNDILDRIIEQLDTSAPSLNWAEIEVLKIFASKGSTPGQGWSVQNLWHTWGTKGTNAQFADALGSLAGRGLVTINQAQTQITLTQLGYETISN